VVRLPVGRWPPMMVYSDRRITVHGVAHASATGAASEVAVVVNKWASVPFRIFKKFQSPKL
jgi:hypothetical protein